MMILLFTLLNSFASAAPQWLEPSVYAVDLATKLSEADKKEISKMAKSYILARQKKDEKVLRSVLEPAAFDYVRKELGEARITHLLQPDLTEIRDLTPYEYSGETLIRFNIADLKTKKESDLGYWLAIRRAKDGAWKIKEVLRHFQPDAGP
jgi:hypothetical protein